MRATLKQIAARSGVSVQTVSRVLGGKAELHREETRKRVIRVAHELGYRPNYLSRALLGGRSRSIGLLQRGMNSAFAIAHARQIIRAAYDSEYVTYVAGAERLGDDNREIIREARDLVDRRVDGLIVYRGLPVGDEALRFLEDLPVPVVYIDWGPPDCPRRFVVDRKSVAHDLARHLKDLGHRRVAYFPSSHSLDYPEHKVRPFQRAFREAGIDLVIDTDYLLEPATDACPSGRAVVSRWLGQRPMDVTALVMNNDEAAIGALAALRDAGLSVPDDLSVAGFDNLPVAAHVNPPLTSIRPPEASIGTEAFAMLERLIEDPDYEPEPRTYANRLIVRESTGPAAGRASRAAMPPDHEPTAGV